LAGLIRIPSEAEAEAERRTPNAERRTPNPDPCILKE
jgi:hypothetical protein